MTTPEVQVGDVVVSKFRNRWTVLVAIHEEWYELHNVPPESPKAVGTTYRGPFPEWAETVERNGSRVWQRPTPKCECPAYASAKGPYPSGFCPECQMWYPGIDRKRAIELGHIPAEPR